MITCESMSERMPDVAAGRAAWQREEAAHLAGCPACAAEWRLVTQAAALGSGRAVDAAAVAQAVLQRLRTEPSEATPLRRPWLLTLAAAAVIVLIFLPRNLVTRLHTAPAPPVAGPLVDLPGLDGLSETELEAVLEQVESPWSDISTVDAPTTGELDEGELERVLREWEG